MLTQYYINFNNWKPRMCLLCGIARLTYFCTDSNKASLVISLNKYENLVNVSFFRKTTALYFFLIYFGWYMFLM